MRIAKRFRYLPQKVQSFIQLILADCAESKFKVIFTNGESCQSGNIACIGYCSETEKILKIATGGQSWKEWFETLVHEYCHFRQWKEGVKVWKLENYFDDWLEDKEGWTPKDVNKHCWMAREVELDCEMRVYKMIKMFKLPISLKHHINWTNFHMCIYAMMKETGKPYRSSECNIRRTLPSNRFMTKREWNNPPEKFRKLYLEHCV